MESSVKALQKIKIVIIIWPSNGTPWSIAKKIEISMLKGHLQSLLVAKLLTKDKRWKWFKCSPAEEYVNCDTDTQWNTIHPQKEWVTLTVAMWTVLKIIGLHEISQAQKECSVISLIQGT